MDHLRVSRLSVDEALQTGDPERNLLVIDADQYLRLADDQAKRLSSFLKLIAVTDRRENDRLQTVYATNYARYYVPDSADPTESVEVNFRSLVDTLATQLQLSQRLNEYISDSFRTIVDAHLLERQKAEIEKLNEELHSISRIDYLTDLLNRRAFLEALNAERKRAHRNRWRLDAAAGTRLPELKTPRAAGCSGEPHGSLTDHIGAFSCMIIDIDYFKRVNDTYGHLAGDEVLRTLGRLLRHDGIFRESDIVGRYGGEEFVVVLPETNKECALVAAERLRDKVSRTAFSDEQGNTFSITVSIGIADCTSPEDTVETLLLRADKALYRAKEEGRDRAHVFTEEDENHPGRSCDDPDAAPPRD